MALDGYVAFGGVALLGIIGFVTAWFSHQSPQTKTPISKKQHPSKEQIVGELAELRDKIQTVSLQVTRL